MISTQTAKDWLEKKNLSRQWLADEIGAKLGTVNNWFTEGSFPVWAEKHIARIIREDDSPDKIRFTMAEFDLLEAARKLAGYEDRIEFFRDALTKYAESLTSAPTAPLTLLKPPPESGLKVADDSPDYRPKEK